MAVLPTLSFVYLDGPEVYVYDAEVVVATPAHTVYGAECHAECETPIVVGQILLTTDPGVEGESTGHLACLLATGASLMTTFEAERLAESVPAHAGR